MKSFLVIAILMISVAVCSQTVMTADRTEVKIGDQIKATITTNLSEGREWRNLDKIWPDTISGIEIVSGPVIDDKNPASVRYTWNISVFDTGWVRIPPLPVVIRKGNQLDTNFTTAIPIRVLPVEPDSTGLEDIKDIIEQPFSLGYYKKYLPHLIIVLLLLAALYYWWRKRNRVEEIPEPVIPEPLPHEWAFKALDDLEQRKLWQGGEVKEHYSYLTAILREYLERRYGINALEQTTDEILDQLSYPFLSHDLLRDTGQLLSVADLIKFAKADPGIDIHAETIERVRRFVRETMSIEEAPSSTNTMPPDEIVE